MPLDTQLAYKLEAALHLHRIHDGIALLTDAREEIGELHSGTPEAGRILLLYSQWIDAGFGDYRLLLPLLERFPPECRKRLPFCDYMRVRMVSGFVDLARGEPDAAIETLGSLLKICRDVFDPGLEALAHFWKGRAHRKNGEYEAALEDMISAHELAHDSDKFFAALVEIQQSWLLFQKGESKDAERLLNRAESVLKATDHYVALANIESARGRIVRRSGQYSEALRHFAKAAEIYAKRDPNHVNLARTLVNAADVRRLLALQMHKQIDADARTGRSRTRIAKHPAAMQQTTFLRYQEICQEAVQELMKAREIYALHAKSGGIGKVSLSLGYLHLDRGEIEGAEREASEAYRIGTEQKDRILIARARILQSAIENAHVEEQTGDTTDIGSHANRAKQFSEEALTLAHGTQNRRLLAGACIARGTTAANDFFQDWETARAFATEATGLIGPGERDQVVEDLAGLKSQIVRASGIDDVLRSWSEGFVGSKTFQQVVEEFAEIVIPKVWIRQDRKISRVAASLSISPKKVRRILRNSGHIDAHESFNGEDGSHKGADSE
jgi:tetratricopeptide (TPR) repeat protein